jgi:2'-5' RNA ligase
MREKDVAKMQDATGVMLENFKKYGYPAAGTLFRPHITLTRLKDHKPEITELLSDVRTFDGTFDRVGLFEMGDNGTCIRKIAEYGLGA